MSNDKQAGSETTAEQEGAGVEGLAAAAEDSKAVPTSGAEEGAEAQQETESEKLAEAQARAEQNWDKYLRAAAELDNLHRRSLRDVQNARKFALEKIAAELIGVRDSLELGVAAAKADDADVARLREGSEMTLRLLTSTLEKFGICELDPEGEPFDPEFHEAMSMQESAGAEPDSVLKVVQKGYTLNDRLLRPARVIVARPAQSDTG